MDNGTRGPTNAIYGMYNNEIIQKSISTQRTCIIEQVYEMLPQDNKRRERKELKKNDTFEAKNSLSFHQLKSTSNGPFYIQFMDYMDTNLSRICPNHG